MRTYIGIRAKREIRNGSERMPIRKKGGAYVPLSNYDTNSRVEALITELFESLENQEFYYKEMKESIWGLSQKIELHPTMTKKLE